MLRRLLIGLPFAWLAAFFLLPLAIVVAISLGESADAIPPYRLTGTLANYRALVEGCLWAYGNSLLIAGLATALCLLIGYPLAFAIARAPGAWRHLLLFFVLLPFWTSLLIRVYAWIALLQPSGLINRVLRGLGLIDAPLLLLNNGFAVETGLVYSYLPFMVLPLYGVLSQLDDNVLEAAADLGARPWRAFLSVVVPLSRPGILAGCLLVFIPAVGEFVIPDLLGGPRNVMVGKVLWQEFFDNVDWPQAATVAVVLVVMLTAPLLIAQRVVERR